MTEQEAINSCFAGNMDAFATLYDLYIQKVYRFIYFRTHHKQTAEDLTSITFTKAFTKFKSFDPKQSFQAWIISIARNTVIDHFRTHKSTSDLEEVFNKADKTNIAAEFAVKEQVDKAKKYLEGLSQEQRDLVIMRLWDDLSYAEIASIVNKKEAALRVSFSRIISKMQTEITLALLLLAIIYKLNL